MDLPNYYEFFNPIKINAGENALNTLSYELEQLAVEKPLILTNQMLDEIKILDDLMDSLAEVNISPEQIIKNIPNQATVEIVKSCAEKYKKYACDGIIALGGEAIIDTAKGINLLISENTKDLKNLRGIDTIYSKMEPFIIIPTATGTGSEAALKAVITDDQFNKDLEFISSKLMPDLAVIDPRMTYEMPPRLTASTGIDSLVHAVEAYTGLQRNPISDAYAFSALKLIGSSLKPLVKDISNKYHRMAMNNAALMSGIAFANSRAGIIYAIGDACEKIAGVSHGDALSILLPHGMFHNLKFEYCRNSYQDILLALSGPEKYSNTAAKDRAVMAVAEIAKLLNELQLLTAIPLTLSEIGVKRKEFPDIIEKAMHNTAVLAAAGKVKREDIESVLEAAL